MLREMAFGGRYTATKLEMKVEASDDPVVSNIPDADKDMLNVENQQLEVEFDSVGM